MLLWQLHLYRYLYQYKRKCSFAVSSPAYYWLNSDKIYESYESIKYTGDLYTRVVALMIVDKVGGPLTVSLYEYDLKSWALIYWTTSVTKYP